MESKPFFIIGIIGYLMLVFHAVFFSSPLDVFGSGLLYISLFTVGLYLGAFTFFGYYQKYNKQLPLITFIASLALSWMMVPSFFLDAILPSAVSDMLFFLGFFSVGVVLVLWGVTLMYLKEETNQVMPLIAGIMFLLAAAPYLVSYGVIGTYFLVACLISVATLLSSEIYSK
jgi:hypothetical protein